MTLDDVSFETGWQTEADATVSSDGPGGRRVTLHADTDATSSHGRLAVRTAGLDQPVTIGVYVVGVGDATTSGALPPPRLRPISVSGLEEGQSRTLDVAGYLDSPLADPVCAITTASVEQGSGLTVTTSGMPADPGRGHPTLAHGIRRARGERRTGPQRAGPGGRDHARQPVGAAPGARRRRPRRRRPGPGVVAPAHLRRRVGGVGLHGDPQRRLRRAPRGARPRPARSPA